MPLKIAALRRMALLAIFGLPLAAQSWVGFLKTPILTEDDRRSMMFSYVDRHLPPIEIPKTKEAWEQARGPLREQILELVGLSNLKSRGPVRWVSKGRIDRDTYHIEKILFESYPGMLVPALIYVPNRHTGPLPAMISIPGHVYCEGKASDSVQARCVNLVRRGIIAMTYDYIDTGERNTGLNACATMPYGGGNDHGLASFSYTAGTPTGLEILDGIRAVDYLYTRPDVDRTRLGFTGESGGSNSTYWVSALDERVKLAVPVCSVTTFNYWIRNNRNWDWHQRPPGIRRIADIPTLLALIAPRPLLVIGSLRGTDSEEFPFEEMQKAVQSARRAYELYGAGQNVEIWESTTAHGYQQDKRERMYDFVERHFLHETNPDSQESAFLLEPQHRLDCGIPEGNKTLASIYAEWLQRPTPVPELPDSPQAARLTQAKLKEEMRELLGFREKLPPPRMRVQMKTSRENILLRQLIIEPEDGIRLPAFEIQPRTASAGIVILPGKSEQPNEAIAAMLSEGLSVLLVDLRGTGEIDRGGPRTDNWAWFTGRPWTGMWTADLIAVTSALWAERPGRRIGLIGTGQFAKSALFASALCPRISASAVRLGQPTYRDETATEKLSDMPRILAVTDLPMVVALSAPRPCRIEFSPELEERFRQAYQWTNKFSVHGFGTAELQLHPAATPDWKNLALWFARTLR